VEDCSSGFPKVALHDLPALFAGNGAQRCRRFEFSGTGPAGAATTGTFSILADPGNGWRPTVDFIFGLVLYAVSVINWVDGAPGRLDLSVAYPR
jgi:hypothetical protein